jgi:hypothetical protein
MYLVRVNTERYSSERKEEKKIDDDGIDGRSGGPRERNSSAEARVLSNVLNEMDGVDVTASASNVDDDRCIGVGHDQPFMDVECGNQIIITTTKIGKVR